MSKQDKKNLRALSVPPGSTGYDVGYGKPPTETRFKSGVSGNPKGRPKGARNKRPALNKERLKEIVLDEAYRTITVRDGDNNLTVPMAQAIIRSLAVNAAKGNHRAQRLFTELLSTTERDNFRLHNEYLETAISYKVDGERELERCKKLGIDPPKMLPHPDHIKINMKTGEVLIQGPMTKEEKVEWDYWRKLKAKYKKDLVKLYRILEDEQDIEDDDPVYEDIEFTKQILDKIRLFIPD
ncbi:MAG: DUF5681 domain-containing protein [Fimbriimonadaceae bacterium]|nr:DUF5681 domain-containing protein [Alphaproteobacteria bacterium]